jgi:hypothetical protein
VATVAGIQLRCTKVVLGAVDLLEIF